MGKHAVIIGIGNLPSQEEIVALRSQEFIPPYIDDVFTTSLPLDTDQRGVLAVYFDMQDQFKWPDASLRTERVDLSDERIIWIVRQI